MRRNAFVSALGALAAAGYPAAARPAAPVVVRAAATLDDDAVPYIYAMQSGLFAKYGIDASLTKAQNGASIAAGVLGGSLEIGKSGVTTLAAAHARGLPLTWIAPAGEYDSSLPGTVALVVALDSPLKSGADINGKTIGVSGINDVFSLGVRAWVDKHGGDSSTLKLTEIPMSASGLAAETGRVDVAVVIEPFLQIALAGGKVRSIGDPISGIANHFMQSCWFTSLDFAAKNPAVVEGFIRAIREGATYGNSHHPETAVMLEKFLNIDTPPTVRIPLGVRFNPAQMQSVVDLQVRYKMLPAAFDVHEVIYPAALRA
ncbi:MAG TPA: ABC transporter substrate-binding protein [Candidatus Lustribacter sp.]|jgi:NitT/TauT family transport system substrate-binding protein|nr:ABC transporter substrate-binding protein [Candidatus Lustribacter sp.]